MRFHLTHLLLFVWLFSPRWCAVADEPSAKDLEFFEKQVRPLLVQHCQECHGPAGKAEGNLRLDGEANWLRGGDSGPALVRGKPEESAIIKAIRYGGEIEMPPTGKLPPEVIKTFEDWVVRGAPAPKGEGAVVARRVIDIEKGKEFWAYRPVVAPSLPTVRDEAWGTGAIDRFVLAKLEAAGIAPSEEASRAVLVRRLYYDLIGLPPTPEQIEAFVEDRSEQAYEKLVDRLLESPHFGERFGRHWLDVARFGESLTLRGFILPNAWRYRDYVIGAYERDLAYDDFIRQQIAGDLLLTEIPKGNVAVHQRRVIATTFLTLGNHNLEEQDKKQLDMDVVDEQLDVIGKGILGQTITCARCHDHKFDPIPTKDYYALAGILRNTQMLEHANVSKWLETPLAMTAAEAAVIETNEGLLADIELQATELGKKVAELKTEVGGKSPQVGQVAISELPGIVVDDTQAKKVGEWQTSQSIRPFVGDGYVHDQNNGKGEKTLTYTPKLPADGKYEVRLSYTPGESRTTAAPVTVFGADGEKTIQVNMKQTPSIDGLFVSLGEFRFEAAGQSFVIVSNEGTEGHVTADAVVFIPVNTASDVKVKAKNSPNSEKAGAEAKDPEIEAKRAKLELLLRDQKTLEEHRTRYTADIAKRPMGMAPIERKEIGDCPVHLRGSVHTLGESAPRGFLQVASTGNAPAMPSDQSGRVQLAEWLASRSNPLTARVYVNRVWHWLLGAGIVRSVDNFGATGETPSHPELLDHLAAEFMEQGWSTKKLVRKIVLSKTYRQASKPNERAFAVDPENRWLWKRNRKRLEAECLRDAMLAISGELDLARAGAEYPAKLESDYAFVSQSKKRSVNLPVFRNAMPEIFEAFDFADPSMVVGARNVSTIAPQALYMLNHSFPRERANAAAKRLVQQQPLDYGRLSYAYLHCFGRPPLPQERSAIEDYLASHADKPEQAWAEVMHSLFASIDFRYQD